MFHIFLHPLQFRLASSLLALLTSLAAASSLAQNHVQNELLANAGHRPTTAEILQRPGALADIEDQAESGNINAIKENLPRLIATLEKAYPGAVFGFLGRDTSLLANAMEAVYLSHGETDRIRYIDLSTPIFDSITADQLTDYLIKQGVSVTKENQRPFVLIDYTSLQSIAPELRHMKGTLSQLGGAMQWLRGFIHESQSTQIINALTDRMRKNGLTSNEMIQRFNILSLANLPYAWDPLQLSETEIQERKTFQAQMLDGKDKVFTLAMTMGADFRDMAYSSEWHDKFTHFATDPKGVIIPRALALPPAKRLAAFAQMVTLINAVTSSEYLANVDSYLSQHNLNLSKDSETKRLAQIEREVFRKSNELQIRSEKLEQKEVARMTMKQQFKRLRKMRTDFDHLIQHQPEISVAQRSQKEHSTEILTRNTPLSAGAIEFSRIYHKAARTDDRWEDASPISEIALSALIKMHARNKIDTADFRHLFEMVLYVPVESYKVSPDLMRLLEAHKDSPALRAVFGSAVLRDVFPVTVRSSALKRFYNKFIDQHQTAVSCQYLYIR